jgi:hypothetical protein
MLEGISDSLSVYDRNWTVLFTNEAGSAPLGLKPADLIGTATSPSRWISGISCTSCDRSTTSG